MIWYTIKRVLTMIPVLLGVSILLFFIQAVAPGDPAVQVLGQDSTQAEREAWREGQGLNDPIVVQYSKYMWGIVSRGDFGNSYRNGKPITGDLMSRWPTTIMVAGLSIVVASVIGILLGIVSAIKRGKWIDAVVRVFSIIGVSLPGFWFALLLIMLFALTLGWFPVSGSYGPQYWVLPIATQGILSAAGIMRYTRAAVLDNVQQDFVRTARAKGQREGYVIRHHIMGNALIPITTSIGQVLVGMMAGTIIIEQIFSLPGLGTLMLTAISQRDYPTLRGSVLLVAVTTSLINLLVDLIYAAIDPRVKARFKSSGRARRKPAVQKG